MSIDISASLYFPVANAAPALKATQRILRRYKSRDSIKIVTPGGEAIAISAYPDSDRKKEGMTYVFDEDVDIRGLVAGVPCLAGRRARGPIHPQLGHAAGELVRRDGKTFAVIPVDIAFSRGRDYMEITFGTFISSVVSAFHSHPFRSRLAHVLAEGGGIAAVYRGTGEWSSFADPSLGLEVPEGFGPEEAGIDTFVGFLHERLS